MQFAFPELKSFCFCIPIRYGLLLWGFFKLVLSVIMLNPIIYGLVTEDSKFVVDKTILLFIASAYFVDIAFTITLLFGAYKKNLRLLRIYFRYCLLILFMFLVTFLISSDANIPNVFGPAIDVVSIQINPLSGIVINIINFGLQVYMIIVVNSMIEDLKRETKNSVENGQFSSEPTKEKDGETC